MDRRQKKTRDAIFGAFARLLEKKAYHRITVQEIIDEANVGRATFYAHFETRELLLKALCDDLFGHIIDTAMEIPRGHAHDTCKMADDSVFLHLLRHLRENDGNILALLSSENNEIFLRYFKINLKRLISTRLSVRERVGDAVLPLDFAINHITSSFVETVIWWLRRERKETPEELAAYFEAVISPLLG